MSASTSLGQTLLAARLIGEDQLRIAEHERLQRGLPLGRVLVELGFVSEAALRTTLAAGSGLPPVDLSHALPAPDALARVPQALARRHRLLPLHYDSTRRHLVVATADAHDIVAIDRLRSALDPGTRIELRLAGEGEIGRAIEQHYGQAGSIDELVRALELRDGDHVAPRDPELVVRLVDALLADAAARAASDLHFEPEAGFLRIRHRIDGTLHQVRALHKSYWPELAVRIKVMAGLDIAESRSPQDGRISLAIGGRPIDFRVATQPTLHGENIVLRILDRDKGIVALDALGLDAPGRTALDRILDRPEGLVLVVGPTGSGKTTTLYSILSHLNSEAVNIMTLEDPVEYPLALIRQTQVGEASRLGFADGVRALLRQDPDILLVGEIRDADTATMALRAALTGHRVFATLHANSALGALPRLFDIGLRAALLAGNLAGIISQRLLRRLCPACREALTATPQDCTRLGLPATAPPPRLYRAHGCPECDFRGYRGRFAIMEVLPFDRHLDALLAAGAGADTLYAAVRERGWRTLAEDGVRRVLDGSTSVPELARVVDLPGAQR
ncbi:GspE/PulE family protein [Thauera chlorobenzoica]|uniref:Type II secretion system protein E n=1 Tax=Thauera chlorobenzoica TaxID=96773 RepID=A0A1H5USE1_9RHOO|nr:GspE/PulE family protein [Thauera chlorobenzoica]APR03482.1 Type II secretion system protein E [Thauera chlorobenzoica]SEF77351.1 general secretion pathway protein E/type IV pilus assembly protein PilB [Thauera chlorobenzoica]